MIRNFLLATILFSTLHAQASLEEIAMPASLLIIAITTVIALFIHIKQLQKSEAVSKTIFTHAPLAMLLITKKNEVLRLNNAMQELLKVSNESMVGKIWYERLLPDETALLLRHQWLHDTEASTTFSAVFITPDGITKNIAWKRTALPNKLILLTAEVTL